MPSLRILAFQSRWCLWQLRAGPSRSLWTHANWVYFCPRRFVKSNLVFRCFAKMRRKFRQRTMTVPPRSVQALHASLPWFRPYPSARPPMSWWNWMGRWMKLYKFSSFYSAHECACSDVSGQHSQHSCHIRMLLANVSSYLSCLCIKCLHVHCLPWGFKDGTDPQHNRLWSDRRRKVATVNNSSPCALASLAVCSQFKSESIKHCKLFIRFL